METAKGLSADVYLTLDAYLEIVVPRVASVRFASTLDLAPGLNVLDLSDRDRFPPELQALVMRSVLEWVYEHADGAITIIPEAWEFLPQGRGSPVKLSAVELIRKGSGLRNYVWLDSQDIGGIEKELLRSCPVWLLGVQRETNEIKRTLENVPAGIARPKSSEIATLQRGQFFACFGETVVKTYVQPAWMIQAEAVGIARGRIRADQATSKPPLAPFAPAPEEPMSNKTDEKLDRLLELLADRAGPSEAPAARAAAAPVSSDEEARYQRFKARLMKEAPKLLRVLALAPEIEVEETRETIEVDGKSLRGRLARLILKGFFAEPRTGNAAFNELKRLGQSTAKPNVYRECDKLAEMGFLTKEGEGYRVVDEMKARITRR